MTPFEKGKAILAEIQALAAANFITLPKDQKASVGNNVIACAGLVVNLVGTNPEVWQNFQNYQSPLQMQGCATTPVGIYVISIARECGHVFNEDGTDNPTKLAAVSEQMDQDGELLWEWATGYEAWMSKEWTSRFVIEGDLAIASLQMTTGVD